jgi:hypothetical protein
MHSAASEAGQAVGGVVPGARTIASQEQLWRRWPSLAAAAGPEHREALAEPESRCKYLAEKLARQLSSQVVDSFVKPPYKLQGSIHDFSIRLRDFIDSSYPANRVHIFVIKDSGDFSIEKIGDSDQIFLAHISSYTDASCADNFTDRSLHEWGKIFEFANS